MQYLEELNFVGRLLPEANGSVDQLALDGPGRFAGRQPIDVGEPDGGEALAIATQEFADSLEPVEDDLPDSGGFGEMAAARDHLKGVANDDKEVPPVAFGPVQGMDDLRGAASLNLGRAKMEGMILKDCYRQFQDAGVIGGVAIGLRRGQKAVVVGIAEVEAGVVSQAAALDRAESGGICGETPGAEGDQVRRA